MFTFHDGYVDGIGGTYYKVSVLKKLYLHCWDRPTPLLKPMCPKIWFLPSPMISMKSMLN